MTDEATDQQNDYIEQNNDLAADAGVVTADDEGVEDQDISVNPEDDFEEIEHEGKQYKVPKELKSAIMKNADYTQKTQEIAETRRSLESDRAAFQESQRLQAEVYQEAVKAKALDDQIKQYEQVDWTALINDDPVRAQQLTMQYMQLKDARAKVAQEIAAKEQNYQSNVQQQIAKQIQETSAILQRDIPNWSPELANKLTEFAVSQGFNRDELREITDARVVKLFHKAYLMDQVIANKPKQDKAQIKPVTTLKPSASNVKKDPTEMSDAEFAKWRQKAIQKRGRG